MKKSVFWFDKQAGRNYNDKAVTLKIRRRKDGWQLWMVARVTTRKRKTNESAYLHCILKSEKNQNTSFLKDRGAGISGAGADNNIIIRKGII